MTDPDLGRDLAGGIAYWGGAKIISWGDIGRWELLCFLRALPSYVGGFSALEPLGLFGASEIKEG